MIRVIAVGKKHEQWIKDGIKRYEDRLKKPFKVEWVLLPHSAKNGNDARQNESQAIVQRLRMTDYVVLLDETGELISSPALSNKLVSVLDRSQVVTIIIGGAYGVNKTLHDRADFIWSLTPLVLPHQLVRLVLTEQVYRSQEIAAGNPYHHD